MNFPSFFSLPIKSTEILIKTEKKMVDNYILCLALIMLITTPAVKSNNYLTVKFQHLSLYMDAQHYDVKYLYLFLQFNSIQCKNNCSLSCCCSCMGAAWRRFESEQSKKPPYADFLSFLRSCSLVSTLILSKFSIRKHLAR